MKKEIFYTISKKMPYLWVALVVSLVLIIAPLLAGVLLSSAPIGVFSLCGVILLTFFLFEYFYVEKCRIIISRRTVEICSPFFRKSFDLYDVYWQAKKMGPRGGYHIDVKHGAKRLIRIHLGWDNVERILLLRHREPVSDAERQVIRFLRTFGE